MEFGVLGPVSLRHDAADLPFGGPKQRALLAMLLLEANRAVSRDALIAGLWGEAPPPSASASLDSYLSRLRRVIGAERLLRRPPGYVLVVAPGELDLERFEALVASAAAQDAPLRAETLNRAIALWRGPALADVLFEPFAARAAEGLDARRLAALEDRIEADLTCHAGAALLAELAALVREHPLRERLVGQQMLALYRAGRPAEALGALQEARHRLSAELGLRPGPQLEELERRILVHDPALDATPSEPRTGHPRRPRRRPRRKAMAGALAAVAALVITALAIRGGGPAVAPADAAGTADVAIALDPTSGARTHVARLPGTPAAALAAEGSVWVTDPSDGLVLRLDPASGTVADRIPVSGQPGALAAAGGAVWVASAVGGAVHRVDPASGAVTQTVAVGGANAVALAAGRGRLWVADASDETLVSVDPGSGTVLSTAHLGIRPSAIVAAYGALWVADDDHGAVMQVDPSTGRPVQVVHVGNGPAALIAAGGAVWVANSLDSTVSRIDPATGTVTATLQVPSGPAALTATRGAVWVASQYAGTVTPIAIATGRAGRPLRIGAQPMALTVQDGHLWAGAGPQHATGRGGTLALVATQRFTTIDPSLQSFASPPQFGALAYDGLVTFRAAPGPAGLRLVPDLAVALPTGSGGGTTYAFRLRRGIRYSDGRLVRASDFRRALERVFRLRSPGTGYFTGIVGAGRCVRRPAGCDLRAGVTTDDARGAVTFRLTAPDPDFLFKLTVFSYAAPIPPGVPDHDVGRHPVPGTGPYRLQRWTDRGLRFVRNARFREWSHAAQPDGNPDAIVWHVARSPGAAVGAVASGAADWLFGQVSPSRLRALQRTSAAQLHANAALVFDFIPLNTHVPPFDDVRVRRALNLAIDRRAIARMYGGPAAALPLCQTLLPGVRGHRSYCPYPHDLARARALVAESGTRGQRIDVWGATDEIVVPRALPGYVAQVLRSLGFTTVLHRRPIARLTAALRRHIQLSVDGDWLTDYPAPSAYVPAFLGCDGGLSNGYVCDRRLQRMMARASQLQLTDGSAADAAWAAVDRRATDQALWVPTVRPLGPDFVSRRVRNSQFHPVWGFMADQVRLR